MIGSKQVKIKKVVYDDLMKIDGSSNSEKIIELLRGYSLTLPREQKVTMLLSAHMNDIKEILETQQKVLDKQTIIIEDFVRQAKPIMTFIEKSTGGY